MAYLYIYGYSSTPCPCCGGEPDCFLTIPPPVGEDSPLPSESEAQEWLDAYTADCVVFCSIPNSVVGGPRTSLSASMVGGTLTISGSSPEVVALPVYVKLKLKAGSYLNVNFNITGATGAFGCQVTVYDSTGAYVGGGSDFTGGIGNIQIGRAAPGPPPPWDPVGGMPADGEYIIYIIPMVNSADPEDLTISVSLGITSTDEMEPPCRIRAAYDDGSGISYVVCA